MKDEPVFEYHAEETNVDVVLADNSTRNIKINPGWSFGTGSHETTRLCIHALEDLFRSENIKKVLDIGCGSGILSLVSSALGAEEVVGIDIDSSIIDEAGVNAKNNNLSENINFSTAHISEIDQKFGLIIANILLKTIISLLPDICDKAEGGGFFIASGIRSEEKEKAVDLIEKSGLKLFDQQTENEWVAVTFKTD